MAIWDSVRRWTMRPLAPAMTLASALVLLNASLTFQNLWPTPAVRVTRTLSMEAALFVLALVLAHRCLGAPSRATLRWLAAGWVVLAIGRYVDVTSMGLFGRQINLYWDLRLLPNVGAMLAAVARPGLVSASVATVFVVPILLYLPLRWALGRVGAAAGDPRTRRAMGLLACATLILFPVQHGEDPIDQLPKFAAPVTAAFGRMATIFVQEATGIGIEPIGPQPAIESNLARIHGADVFVVFLESYGAVSWDHQPFAEGLAASRERFQASLRDTGREVVSGFVGSPTFGGGSWLAHVNLLSGTEVRDENTNVRLMAQPGRNTMVTTFARRGYRTVAIMPGLQQAWPEGAFYGFDDIYGTKRLGYRGPTFGWWDLTDQFTIARMDELVVAPSARKPLFVFFPTISTHAPFVPTPPYQPDWPRMLTPDPYDAVALDEAWSDQPDWENLGPAYVKSLAYAFDSIGGYLRLRADRDFVVILIGDHQPPALITGQGASWEVPVHIVASRPDLLEQLRGHGFSQGLTPHYPSLVPMHALTAILLDSFDDRD